MWGKTNKCRASTNLEVNYLRGVSEIRSRTTGIPQLNPTFMDLQGAGGTPRLLNREFCVPVLWGGGAAQSRRW